MGSWKRDRVISFTTTMIFLGFTSLAYQNCSKAKFGIDPAAKSQALDKEYVFEEDVPDRQGGDDGQTGGVRPGDDGTSTGSPRPGNDGSIAGGNKGPGNDGTGTGTGGTGTGGNGGNGKDNHLGRSFLDFLLPRKDNNSTNSNTPTATTNSLDINFRFLCSNKQTEANAGNLLTASAVKIVIAQSSNGPVLCELTGDFKASILNNKKINFTPCANLAPGSYYAYIVDTAVASSDMNGVDTRSLNENEIRFNVVSSGAYTLKSKSKIDILYDLNQQHETYATLVERFSSSTASSQALCEQRASPLIISLNSSARGISLTSPLDGIQFDILGERSSPMAHAKKQISWLTAEKQEYFFIALPNESGEVLGINELFGDNTRGPDGKFAANGYAALAKYDDDGDDLITEDDAIFSKLRLWGDPNRDGIAQPEELLGLKDKAIMVIDLNFDKRYKEEDQYGNQTLMKSVIKTEDGKLHLVFDLWFRHLNITK